MMIQNLQAWENHFKNMSEGKTTKKGKLFIVGSQLGRGDKPIIELVSPAAQVVEMAQSQLKRQSLKRKALNKVEKKGRVAKKRKIVRKIDKRPRNVKNRQSTSSKRRVKSRKR